MVMKIKPYTEKPLEKQSEDFKTYTKDMVEGLKNVPKRPVSTVQCASMVALEERHKDPKKDEEYEAWRNSPEYMKAIKGKTPERIISPDEFVVVEGLRRSSKNTLGASEKSATTEEGKKLAIDAFTCSEPAKLTKAEIRKLKKLDSIKELDSMPREEKKKSFLDLFKRLFATKQETDTHSYAELQQFFAEQEKDKKK